MYPLRGWLNRKKSLSSLRNRVSAIQVLLGLVRVTELIEFGASAVACGSTALSPPVVAGPGRDSICPGWPVAGVAPADAGCGPSALAPVAGTSAANAATVRAVTRGPMVLP